MNKKLYPTLIILSLLSLLASGSLVACESSEKEPTKVSVRLKWLHQTQFAGIYVAEQEGYYDEENLEVTIEPIDLDRQVTLQYVQSGENDIAIAAAEEVIISHSEQETPVQAIAVIFRITPLVYASPQEAGITSPADLEGKTVGLSPGQGTYLYEAMMGQLDVDRDKINEIEMTSWDIFECWETSDVCATYATNALAQAKHMGREATALWPSDYGVPFYGDVIIATKTYIDENPDVVERFIRATLKGWQKAIEDPELATRATLAFDESLDYDLQFLAMEMSIPLIDTGEGQIGLMHQETWEKMHDILLDQGLIDTAVNLAAVYTNEFAEKANE